MRTEKVAITIPSDLVSMIDDIRRKRGVSRSKFITLLLREKIIDEQAREIWDAYDRVFSDESPSFRNSWTQQLGLRGPVRMRGRNGNPERMSPFSSFEVEFIGLRDAPEPSSPL